MAVKLVITEHTSLFNILTVDSPTRKSKAMDNIKFNN